MKSSSEYKWLICLIIFSARVIQSWLRLEAAVEVVFNEEVIIGAAGFNVELLLLNEVPVVLAAACWKAAEP